MEGSQLALQQGIDELLNTQRSLGNNITDVSVLNSENYICFSCANTEKLEHFGIKFQGNPNSFIVLENISVKFSHCAILSSGVENVFFLGAGGRRSGSRMNIRSIGNNNRVPIPNIGPIFNLNDCVMRGQNQRIYIGAKTTAVGINIEIEGEGSNLAIGDDCLISSGVWIRNHDMHALFDVDSKEILNKITYNTSLEKHVWLGQDCLLLGVDVVGKGSIVGAKSLVKRSVPSCVAVGGVPAKVLRTRVGWSRQSGQITTSDVDLYKTFD